MVWKWTFWLLPLLLLSSVPAVRADGVFLDGLFARSIGRGGTNIAYADNGGVLFDNPAGAVNIEGQGLVDFGVDGMLTHFNYGDPASSDTDTSMTPLPQMAWIQKSADGQWAYGIGLFVPAGFTENFDLEGPVPLVGQQHYKSFGSLAKVLPTLSYRLTERLSLGATLGVGISHDEFEGPFFLQGPDLPGTPTRLDLQGTGAAMIWSVGGQYALTDATTLGLAYQSQSRFHLHGTTQVEVPLMGATRYDSETDMTWPSSLGMGIRHAICPHHTISADAIWCHWSQAFDDFGIHLANSSTPGFPPLYEQLPLHWQDTVSVRLGYERTFEGGRVFRCGYVHHQSPIENSYLTPFIQATMEHALSLGYGWQYQGWNMDLGYMYSFGATQHVDTSALLGGDFSNSSQRAQAHAICLELAHPY